MSTILIFYYVGSMQVLRDVGELLNLTLNQAQSRQALFGSTIFNRIEITATSDPLNGDSITETH